MNTKDCAASAKAAFALITMVGAISLIGCGNQAKSSAPATTAPVKAPANPLVGSWALPDRVVGSVTESERMTVQDRRVIFTKTCKTPAAAVVAEVSIGADITDRNLNLKENKSEEAEFEIGKVAGAAVFHTCRVSPFFLEASDYELKEPNLSVTEQKTGIKTELVHVL